MPNQPNNGAGSVKSISLKNGTFYLQKNIILCWNLSLLVMMHDDGSFELRRSTLDYYFRCRCH